MYRYTTVRNDAGWFVSWRVDYNPTSRRSKTSEFRAWRLRKDAKAWVLKQVDAAVDHRLGEASVPHRVRLLGRFVSAQDLKRWMRGRPGTFKIDRDSTSRIYAFEDPHIAFEFKNAFG